MARYTFQQLFRLVDDNTIEVLQRIKIGSFEIDEGAYITRGVNFAGIDLFKYVDADFEGDNTPDGEALNLERIYPHG
jgi:hypothetical protein